MTKRANPAALIAVLAVALVVLVGGGVALGTIDTAPSKADLQPRQQGDK